MKKSLVGILASLLCVASVALCNQPTDKATNLEKRLMSSPLASSSTMEVMHLYLTAEFANVEAGKTVVFSSVVMVSRLKWETKKDEILTAFETKLSHTYQRNTLKVGYESIGGVFSTKNEAKEVLDASIIETLNQRSNVQFVEFAL